MALPFVVIPVKAGIHGFGVADGVGAISVAPPWIPACAGMTEVGWAFPHPPVIPAKAGIHIF